MSLANLELLAPKPWLSGEIQNLTIDGTLTVNGSASIPNSLIASYSNINPTPLTAGQYLNLFGSSTTITNTATPYNALLSTGQSIGKVSYYAVGSNTSTQFTIRNGALIVGSITFFGSTSGFINFTPSITIPVGNTISIAYASGSSPTSVTINLYED